MAGWGRRPRSEHGGGDLGAAAAARRAWLWRFDCSDVSNGGVVIEARGGGGGRGGSMSSYGNGDDGGSRSPSSIFHEQSLEKEFTPFFLQMIARVCAGFLLLLKSPRLAERGKGPLEAHERNSPTYHRIKGPQIVGFLSGARKGGSTKKPKGERER